MIDATLQALADPVRRRVVDRLRAGPVRATDLARELDAPPPAMSRHLRVLREAGLVEPQGQAEDARVRLYRLRPEPFDELRRWVEEVEAFWTAELAAFRDHVHGRSG